jgi:hypothetical protein
VASVFSSSHEHSGVRDGIPASSPNGKLEFKKAEERGRPMKNSPIAKTEGKVQKPPTNGHAYPTNVRKVAGDERAGACAVESKYVNGSSAGDSTLRTVPTVSAAATGLSLAAAGNQFSTFTRFGSQTAEAVSIEDRLRTSALRREQFESAFIREGSFSIDPNGELFMFFVYSEAVVAIQAKAAAPGLWSAVQIRSCNGCTRRLCRAIRRQRHLFHAW